MVFNSKGNSLKTKLLAVILLILGTMGFFVKIYGAWFQLAGILFVVAGIFIFQRYCLSDYKFVITPDDMLHETNDFTVIKITGKKEITECKVSFYDIERLYKLLPGDKLENKCGKVNNIFNYCTDPFSKEKYVLTFVFNESRIAILFQSDDNFGELINKRIKSIKQEDENDIKDFKGESGK